MDVLAKILAILLAPFVAVLQFVNQLQMSLLTKIWDVLTSLFLAVGQLNQNFLNGVYGLFLGYWWVGLVLFVLGCIIVPFLYIIKPELFFGKEKATPTKTRNLPTRNPVPASSGPVTTAMPKKSYNRFKWIVALLIGFVVIVTGIGISLIGTYWEKVSSLTGDLIIVAIELIVFTVVMIPLLCGIVWKKGWIGGLFTTVETGNIKFIDVGETNWRTYINIPGKILSNGEIVNGDSEGSKDWIQKTFGRYWVGPRFLGRKVHTFTIPTDKEKENITPDMNPAEWINHPPPRSVDELRWKFPRPVLVPDVKFQDNIEANILVLCKFEVLRPNVPIYIQKGAFFETLVNYVRSGMVNYCQKMDATEFAQADRVDGGVMSQEIIKTINPRIEEELGIRLTGLAIPIYNESSTEEEEALKAEELAKLQGLAAIAKATADGKALVATAKAQAKADIILATASVADVTASAKEFLSIGADGNIAAQSAVALGRAKRLAEKNSPITTFLDGGQANVALPLPEKKVVLTNR